MLSQQKPVISQLSTSIYRNTALLLRTNHTGSADCVDTVHCAHKLWSTYTDSRLAAVAHLICGITHDPSSTACLLSRSRSLARFARSLLLSAPSHQPHRHHHHQHHHHHLTTVISSPSSSSSAGAAGWAGARAADLGDRHVALGGAAARAISRAAAASGRELQPSIRLPRDPRVHVRGRGGQRAVGLARAPWDREGV